MHVYLRGSFQQKLRLVSGLVLFAFAATHFLNHALALINLEAMHQMQSMRTAVTRSALGTAMLAGALVIHIALALYKLARRETWSMPRWEAAQIGLGLAIPFLLFPHIINTRIAHTFFDVQDSYLYELARLWPDSAVVQISLLLLVWTHGCLGLHYWLRLSDAYRRVAPALRALAVAVPVLAIAGFVVGGETTRDIMSDPQAMAALKARSRWPNEADSVVLAWLRTGSRLGFLVLLGALIALVLSRRVSNKLMRRAVRITYVDGSTVELTPGKTLLEVSRSAGVSHASVCGGRGRCSTCRVRVEKGLERLPPPTGAEAITLRSIEAPDNIRLACQLRPVSDLTVAIVSRPATPGPPQDGFAEIKEFVAAHVWGVLGDQLVEVSSADAAMLERWLAEKSGRAIPVRDLQVSGFALEGARLEYPLDRPTAAIVYRRQGHIITLFAGSNDTSVSLAMRGQRNGYHVLAWTEGNLAFVAVSDLAARELDRLEDALRPSEPILKIDARSAVV